MVIGGVGLAAELAHRFGRGFAKADAQLRLPRAQHFLHRELYAAMQLLSEVYENRRVCAAVAERTKRVRMEGNLPGLVFKQRGAVFYEAVFALALPEDSLGRDIQATALIAFCAALKA